MTPYAVYRRALGIGLAFGAVLTAQQGSRQVMTSSVYADGSRVAGPTSSETWSRDSYSKTTRSVNTNGRIVPSESIEERVVHRDANQTVTERLTQHYDYSGAPAGQERVRIEERQNPDGSQTVVKSSYQMDLHGRL